MHDIMEDAKFFFFSGRATKRGGGGEGRAAKKKELFLKLKKIWPLGSKGRGGGKALVAGPLKKRAFLRLIQKHLGKIRNIQRCLRALGV